MEKGSFKLKVGLAEMLKGGVIMDVTNPEQAIIAEKSGAVAVMALEKIPADIRRDGGIARMTDPKIINDPSVFPKVILSGDKLHFSTKNIFSITRQYFDEKSHFDKISSR